MRQIELNKKEFQALNAINCANVLDGLRDLLEELMEQMDDEEAMELFYALMRRVSKIEKDNMAVVQFKEVTSTK